MRMTLAVCLLTSISLADTNELDLRIDWSEGSIAGTQSYGIVTYDDELLAYEWPGGYYATPTQGNLTVDVWLNGVHLDESADGGWRLDLEKFGVPWSLYAFVSEGVDRRLLLTQTLSAATYADGQTVRGTYTLTPTPEPGTCALFGLALAGYAIYRRRRAA